MFLSKSNFMFALDCPKALLLKKNRRDMMSEIDKNAQKRFDDSNYIQETARLYYPVGVMCQTKNTDKLMDVLYFYAQKRKA